MPTRQKDRVYWRVRVDAEVAARVERYLLDPTRGKPQYGARSALVEELLRRWLSEMEPEKIDA